VSVVVGSASKLVQEKKKEKGKEGKRATICPHPTAPQAAISSRSLTRRPVPQKRGERKKGGGGIGGKNRPRGPRHPVVWLLLSAFFALHAEPLTKGKKKRKKRGEEGGREKVYQRKSVPLACFLPPRSDPSFPIPSSGCSMRKGKKEEGKEEKGREEIKHHEGTGKLRARPKPQSPPSLPTSPPLPPAGGGGKKKKKRGERGGKKKKGEGTGGPGGNAALARRTELTILISCVRGGEGEKRGKEGK